MNFLRSCDTPNWAVMLMFLLCYAHSVMGEKLEQTRAKLWSMREKATVQPEQGEGK